MNINEIWGENCCNDNSFCQLKSLEIVKCPNLEFAIPLVMLSTFQNLEKLEIKDCNSVVSEVESSSSSELMPYVALRSIKLFNLPVLTQTRLNSCGRNSYPNLETFDIEKCNSLKNVFLPSTVKHLVRLRELKVTNCEMMSEIIGEKEKEGETIHEFVFPELTLLQLDSLPNFTRFCFSESVEVLQHQSYLAFKVSFPKLVIIKFNLKTIKFEEMAVGRYDSASEIKELVVTCDNQVQLPSKLKLQFPNMEKLTMKNCWWYGNFCISNNKCIEGAGEFLVDRAEELMLQDVNREAFSNMRKLSIESCKDMEHVACIPHNELLQSPQSFSKLTELRINSCSGMKYLFPAHVAKCLVELQQLHVQNCPALEVIIRKESAIPGAIIKFPELKELILTNLQSLRSFFGKYGVKSSSSTTIMDNTDASTAGAETLFDGMVSFPKLEVLEFSGKTIILDEIEVGRNDSASEIKKLVLKCDNNVQLPSKWQLQFPNTEELSLYNCRCDGNFCIFGNRCVEGGGHFLVDRAEEVVLEEVKGSLNGFSNRNREAFSNMRSLSIESCEGMEHVACIPHDEILLSQPLISFSKLTELKIKKCSELKYLFSACVAKCLVELQRLHIENCPVLQVVIGNESAIHEAIIFPKLRLLILWNLESLKRLYGEYRGTSSRSTTIMENVVISPDASESPFDGMVCFPNIEILKFNVKGSSDFFSIDAFPNLKSLFIGSCEDKEYLACISHYQILQSQPLTPFSGLSKLFIDKCLGLKYLFCVSVAKCLVQLQELLINDCPTLEAVIQNESTTDGGIINFPKLNYLALMNLQSLRRFYWEKTCRSSSSSTLMENAAISSDASESLFDGAVSFPALETLWLLALETSGIWEKNYYKDNSFSQLTYLGMERCHNLEFAIPLAMLPTFQNLEELGIAKCDSMSEIIRKEENQEKNYELVFPELTRLELKDLPNLKNFCINEFVAAQASSSGHQFHLATKVSFPKMLELEFYRVKTITLDEIELSKSDSPSELKKLDVWCGNGDQLPFEWQLQLPNIEELKLRNCWWHGSNGEHNVNQFLINPYGTVSFQSLKVVEVCSCGVSALFSCSVFMTLHQLQKLLVKNCPLLEEVVREEDNVVGTYENPVSFLKLEYIELKHLPKLKSFSGSAGSAFNLPALKSIVLRNCPQMEKFTFLEISTQSNPNKGSEEDSSDSDSDKEEIFDADAFMETFFDAYLSNQNKGSEEDSSDADSDEESFDVDSDEESFDADR